jgi:hypothetical protein
VAVTAGTGSSRANRRNLRAAASRNGSGTSASSTTALGAVRAAPASGGRRAERDPLDDRLGQRSQGERVTERSST